MLDNPSAYTQERVDEATDHLFTAVALLDWVKGDPYMLQLLVERGDQMMANADKYVETNWQQLVGALDAAKKILADASDSMQYEMDKVSEVLLEAILAQRYKADKSILEGLLAEAETVDTTGASEVAVATFRTALATARAVMADATLSVDDQAKVDEAAAALKAAMDGLTAGGAPETTDKPEASEKPETTNKPESTDKPQATEKPAEKPAQTGDSAQLMLYVAALGAAVVALSTATVVRKRRGN